MTDHNNNHPSRRGRPPLDPDSPHPSERVEVSLTAIDYGKAAQVARRNRESVQDVIRRSLRRELTPEFFRKN